MSSSLTHFDVFNGDADGICALLQLRKTTPIDGQLITGVKRNIQLLQSIIHSENIDSVCVLDISMEKNQAALQALLERDIATFYCDHHRTGAIPESTYLTTQIDTSPETCTSLLINQYLSGAQYLWACTGAFGDNLMTQATALGQQNGLTNNEIEFLKQLGTLINYNGYGHSIQDLHFHPQALYQKLYSYPSPLALQSDKSSVFYQLKEGFDSDWAQVQSIEHYHSSSHIAVYLLPNQAWARRISGTFGNWLANQYPDQAIAVITANPEQETYTVSVRSPLNRREGADELCSQFPSGGGRKAAAGINALQQSQLDEFIEKMQQQFAI
ncbi:DHHA1 domain-containing protein [Vibrio sp. B1Z05]|uniref:DHHA1 domain-containing protein n=1 Tax=Vibrio sp. B1Z05 TaxID=2654980 RepID=UPI00128D911B|nr:DHH family phosphoesterase [Vibrio sp. B1Z05]MPW35909.1 DHH family phosphoesterase [Vibrio sp. B1Z05]